MSLSAYLTLLETLYPLSSREARLSALPGLLEPWEVMVYDASFAQGSAVYEQSDCVARLVGEDETQTQALAGVLSHLLSTAAKHRETGFCHDFTRLLTSETQPLEVNSGAASFPKCAPDQEALLELADQHMYRAKSAGHSVYQGPSDKLVSDEFVNEEAGSLEDMGVEDVIFWS